MLVSCLMPTYAKYVNPKLDHTTVVEEAIESFLRQTYTNSELIILNDQASLTYVFKHPRVRIINVKGRFQSLGRKRNATVHAARGELCAIWDDDDISMPERLQNIVDEFTTHPNLAYAGSGNVLFSTHNQDYKRETIHDPGRFAAGAFRKQAVLDCPYRDISVGEDSTLCTDLAESGVEIRAYHSQRADFLYRWGLGVWHISGNPIDNYKRISEQPFVEHVCYLNPHWEHDYVAVRDKLESV